MGGKWRLHVWGNRERLDKADMEEGNAVREKPGKTNLDQSMGSLPLARYLHLTCRQWEPFWVKSYETKVCLYRLWLRKHRRWGDQLREVTMVRVRGIAGTDDMWEWGWRTDTLESGTDCHPRVFPYCLAMFPAPFTFHKYLWNWTVLKIPCESMKLCLALCGPIRFNLVT